MCCNETTLGSGLNQTKIQSEKLIDASCATLADGVESVLAVLEMPRSQSQLFKLKNIDAAGAVLTSFRATGYTTDADGNALAIDAAGNLVTEDSIDSETGIGTALTAEELEAAPTTIIKDRLAGCGQTPLAEVEEGADNALEGDTGAAGNCYILELHKSEYGFQASEQCQEKPCFVCITAEVAGGGGMFALASVQCNLDFNVPPATTEYVA